MKLAHRVWPATGTETAKITLLHGMGGTGALWRPLAIALEDHFAVLAPDQRGHGQSLISTPGESGVRPTYTPLDYGQDLNETLASENFSPTWIVGHSMGVRSACAAAHLHPDGVSGLILVDLGFSGMAGGGLGEDLARFVRVLPDKFASRNEARAFMERECPDPSIAQYLLAVSQTATTVAGAGTGELTFPFDHAALIETIEAARDSSVRPWVIELARGGMPIWVVRGAESRVWSAKEFSALQSEFSSYPSVRFVTIQGAGHGLPFEKRLEFAALIRQAVAEK